MSAGNKNEIERLNGELQGLLEAVPKDMLARAARLLGMYVALYKQHFGELTSEDYRRLNAHVAVQDELGRAIYRAGMHELICMLDLVHDHAPGNDEMAGRSIN